MASEEVYARKPVSGGDVPASVTATATLRDCALSQMVQIKEQNHSHEKPSTECR